MAQPPIGYAPLPQPSILPGARVSMQGGDGAHYIGTVSHTQAGMLYVTWASGQQSWVNAGQVRAMPPAKPKRNTRGCLSAILATAAALIGVSQILILGQRVEHETLAVYAGAAVVFGLFAMARRLTSKS